MLTHKEKSALSPTTPGLQIIWSASSLGELKRCARNYQLAVLEGWRPKAESVHLTFGTLVHKALETYDRARADGLSHELALRLTIRGALVLTWNKELGRPWLSDDPAKNRLTLLRLIVWYTDQFQNDALETIRNAEGEPMLEVSFMVETPYESPSDGPYLLYGRLDKLATMAGANYVLDRKTTGWGLDDRYFAQFSPDNQVSEYAIGAAAAFRQRIAGLMIDAIQVGATFVRCSREVIGRSPDQLAEWLVDLGWWLRQAEAYAKAQHWPMNDKACHGPMGACNFVKVCSKSPGVRDAVLAKDFRRVVFDALREKK